MIFPFSNPYENGSEDADPNQFGLDRMRWKWGGTLQPLDWFPCGGGVWEKTYVFFSFEECNEIQFNIC